MQTTNGKDVRRVLQKYIEATFKGDVEKLTACFHNKAVMNGYLNGELLIGTAEPFFEDIGSRPSMASRGIAYTAEIVLLDIADQIASATVKETGFEGGLSFINYFHLIFTDMQWKIYSKTFTTL